MKSITIHNFEDNLEKSLVDYANFHKLSMNKSVKKLLKKALGIGEEKKENFSDLRGVIDKRHVKSIINALKRFEKIDSQDWK